MGRRGGQGTDPNTNPKTTRKQHAGSTKLAACLFWNKGGHRETEKGTGIMMNGMTGLGHRATGWPEVPPRFSVAGMEEPGRDRGQRSSCGERGGGQGNPRGTNPRGTGLPYPEKNCPRRMSPPPTEEGVPCPQGGEGARGVVPPRVVPPTTEECPNRRVPCPPGREGSCPQELPDLSELPDFSSLA